MRNWHDLLPCHDALEQAAWERRQRVLRGRQAGMKLHEIGSILGVGKERIRQIIGRATRERIRPAPIERYYRERGEVVKIYNGLKQLEKRHKQSQQWL